MLAEIMSRSPINHSFCLVLSLLRAYAPLHASEPTRTLLSPFLPLVHVCVCMHVFSIISRSCMYPKPNPDNPLCLHLSCFSVPPCPNALMHPCKPNYTHPYLCTPVHTLHYLCIENTTLYMYL